MKKRTDFSSPIWQDFFRIVANGNAENYYTLYSDGTVLETTDGMGYIENAKQLLTMQCIANYKGPRTYAHIARTMLEEMGK